MDANREVLRNGARALALGTMVLAGGGAAPAHEAEGPGAGRATLQELFGAEVAQCIAETRKAATSMRKCYNRHAARDAGTSWFPRTRAAVEATTYDYGLYVKAPLERAVEHRRR